MVLFLGLHLSARDAVAQGSAAAQGSSYVGGSAFADFKQFGSTRGVYYGAGEDFSLDGTGVGGGLRVGSFLQPWLSLELAIDAGTATTSDVPDPYMILAIFPPPPIRDMKASTQFLSVSTVLGYHPPARGRLRLGYLGGLSFVRGTYKSDYPSYILPLAVFSEAGAAAASLPLSRPTFLPPPNFSIGTLTERDLTTGVILGFEAAIDLAGRLAVVPEVRALAFSTPNNGPGVFLIRPGVGVRWSF
jgi:hypothetical protein